MGKVQRREDWSVRIKGPGAAVDVVEEMRLAMNPADSPGFQPEMRKLEGAGAEIEEDEWVI